MENVSKHENSNEKSSDQRNREINILLLGETGVGKTTTLNALANYLMHSSFKDALASLNSLTQFVSCQFVLYDPNTRQPWMVKSNVDDDTNERYGEHGNSVTQAPIGYTFKYSDYTVRVIDTPGIGDTGGTEEDQRNFDKIFQYLQDHEHLNAILIIVKGNETRKTTFFKYCLTELLTHLHKSVCQNIMFCFTFSRTNDFGPGDGFATLKAYLNNDLEVASLQLSSMDNCFFIDNEAFRFMMAKKQNFPFSEKQEDGFRDSWEESAQQIEIMLERILALPPHELNKTISLNIDRKIVVDLAQPMIQIQKTIKQNIEYIQGKQSELEQSIRNKRLLDYSLYIEVKETRAKQLKIPVNACINKLCCKMIYRDEPEQANHIVCHENCNCWFVTENSPEQKFIKFCKVIKVKRLGLGSAKCRVCGCSWRYHLHLSTLYKNVSRTVYNTEAQDNIKSTEDTIEQYRNAIIQTEQLIVEYVQEENVIKEILTKLECLLNENSIYSQRQCFEQYFDYLIQTEQSKGELAIGQKLEDAKLAHRNSVRVLSESIQRKEQKSVQIEDVPALMEQLLQLKHSGPSFRQIFIVKKTAAHDRRCKRSEQEVQVTEL